MTIFNPYEFEPVPARAKLENLLKRGRCVFEPKLDGARQILTFIDGKAYMTGRRRSVVTNQMLNKIDLVPHLESWITQLQYAQNHKLGIMFDGEIVTSKAYSHSNEVTSILNSKPERAKQIQHVKGKLQYVIFDIVMYLNMHGTYNDLRNLSYIERRAILENFKKTYPSHFEKDVTIIPIWDMHNTAYQQAFEYARNKGYEGVIAKLLDGKYHRNNWAKIKAEEMFDMVITGYVPSDSLTYAGNGIAALELGLYDKHGILNENCCRCSGMTEEWRYEFYHDFELVEDGYNSKYLGKVVEVTGQEMYPSGAIRHPRFVRIRTDKDAEDCTFEHNLGNNF